MDGNVQDGWRLTFHFPWLEDVVGLHDPDVVLLTFVGLDTDDPPDASDDLSGAEPFYAQWQSIDGCGEPLAFFSTASLEGGALDARDGVVALPVDNPPLLLRSARVWGHIEPEGGSSELLVCGYVAIDDIGGRQDAPAALGDLSWLEVFLAGSEAAGVSGYPGVAPDVDLDGDGLERFITSDLRIETCIDGEGATIAGRDCWQDPRIADGFSFNLRFRTVRAEFEGREPGWQERRPCPGGPPDPSLFDP
jgi:hypothetical protein